MLNKSLISRVPTLFLAFVCSLALLSASGCCTDEYLTSTCGTLPTGQVEGFDVTIRTGSDGTDADIFFCFGLADSTLGVESCTVLDSSLDDFETGSTATYQIPAVFPAESFDTFWIENRGGGILGESGWDIDALSVVMRTVGGSTQLYAETNIVCNEEVDGEEMYVPGGCTWEP